MTTDATSIAFDQQLIQRARAGDAAAMHDLLSELRPAIHRYCRFRLSTFAGGVDAAEDAVQETCLVVSSVLVDYQDRGLPFKAWVYAIAAKKVADSQRRSHRAAVLVDQLPEQVEPSFTPEEAAVASAEVRAALVLVDRLPARMRQVVLLRAGGTPAKQVAEALGMTPGAVNVAHHRAVTRLRQWAAESVEYSELLMDFGSGAVRPGCVQAA